MFAIIANAVGSNLALPALIALSGWAAFEVGNFLRSTARQSQRARAGSKRRD